MFEKSGKFFADYRDRTGARKRKSFQTRRAALQFEAQQKELAHPKPKAQGRPSPKFSAPDTPAKTVRNSTAGMRPRRSSQRLAAAPRAKSARRTSRT